MNNFSTLLLERFQLFSVEHPTLGLIVLLFGAFIAACVTLFRINFMLQEKAVTLNTQRFEMLMNLLQQDNAESVNPLYLELAFQKAFRQRQSRDQIIFALRYRNPSSILFDMWHGRSLVRLNSDRTTFVLKRNHWISLRFRERALDALLTLLAAPGFMLAFVYSFFEPSIGIVFVIEFAFFIWLLLDSIRTLACAQRLLIIQSMSELRGV